MTETTHRIPVLIEVLSPVHIGSGEHFFPTDFVLDESNQQLLFFDPLLLSQRMREHDEKQFQEFCDFCGTMDPERDLGRYREYLQPWAAECCTYRLELSERALDLLRNNRRDAFRQPFARHIANPWNNLPYIPGSTIKGMLKTAHLHRRLRPADREPEQPFGLHDPFRILKVGDFRALQISSRADTVLNLKKANKQTGQREFNQIPDNLQLVESGSLFLGDIRFQTHIWQAAMRDRQGGDPFSRAVREHFPDESHFGADHWQRLVQQYGSTLWHKERAAFGIAATDQTNPKYRNQVQTYRDWCQQPPQEIAQSAIAKIGKHGGALSKTAAGGNDDFAHMRKIKIRLGKNKTITRNAPFTTWLDSSGHPLGWVRLHFLDESQEREYLRQAQEFRQQQERHLIELEQRRSNALEQSRRLVEQQRERAAEAQRQQAEREARERELASMDPLERQILELDSALQDSAIKDRLDELSQNLFRMIEDGSADQDAQLRAAQLLKKTWQALGKWTSKQASKKQKPKNQHIRQILGE